MTKVEEQILVNQIMIMEALITIFRQGNDDFVARRNLEIYAEATYNFLKENRSE